MLKKKTLKSVLRNPFLSLQSISIRYKVAFHLILGTILITVAVVEYAYYVARQTVIDQFEKQVRSATLQMQSEIQNVFLRMDRKELNQEKALDIIRNSMVGPMMEIRLTFRQSDNDKGRMKEQIGRMLGIFDPRISDAFDIKEIKAQTPDGLTEYLVEKRPGGEPLGRVQRLDAERALFRALDPWLIRDIYDGYYRLSRKDRQTVRQGFQFEIVRNLSVSSLRLGNTGYGFALTAYTPEWMIQGTTYPRDYTENAIRSRYTNNFSETGYTAEETTRYKEAFGQTAGENLAFVSRDMKERHTPANGLIAVIHPFREDEDLDNVQFDGTMVVREMMMQRQGFYRYPWQNSGETSPRQKLIYLTTFEHPQLQQPWVIAVGGYEDEVLGPIQSLHRNLYILLFAAIVVFALSSLAFLQLNIIVPLNRLLEGISRIKEHDLTVRVKRINGDEIGFVTRTFNQMVRLIADHETKLSEYARTLENRVQERTQELSETLAEVQQLKERQDGDYYLTSLVLNPLISKKVSSETVSVDFRIRQKKSFHFRKWSGEIGGDICIARSLSLKGRDYTAFLNADAMGKSIQGASGALVIGSVFESILERTVSAAVFRNHYPERWLKNSFRELAKIFLSFDGAMGASLVIGLVDDRTGTVYYINAEHPFGVLYRKGRASFIETEAVLKRIGIPESTESQTIVRTFQMQPGDVLLFGSDGKDDLDLGGGNRNDDEYLFLSLVEQSGGDLDSLTEQLGRRGELTDDLSLLRIEFSGMTDRDGRRTLTELINHHIKQEDYAGVLSHAWTYLDEHPATTDILYTFSYAFRKVKDYATAAELGERIYLREPDRPGNLVNLAYCHVKMSSHQRAEFFAQKALDLDPGNDVARRIQDMIAEARPSQGIFN